MAFKGKFKPKNPQKYKGNPTNIIYRSSYELKMMIWLDKHKEILEWSSEELIIPYISSFDNKVHRYFPDFWVKKINKNGEIEINIIEIKPYKQTIEPKKPNKITRSFVNEVVTWKTNNNKWDSAKEYCKKRNWSFKILTEKELGILT